MMKRNNVLNINMIDIISPRSLSVCVVVMLSYHVITVLLGDVDDDDDGYFIILDKSNLNLLQNWNISRWI